MSRHESNEGAIIAWSLLIMVVCISGSIVTRTSLVDFFFVAVFCVLILAMMIGLSVAIISLFVYVFKQEKGSEKRTLIEVFRQQMSNNRIIDNYGLLFHYLGEYFAETETYVFMMRNMARMERAFVRFVRYPVRKIFRRPADKDDDLLEDVSEEP